MDETEGLVRIYDREWRCQAEKSNPIPTAAGAISPCPSDLPPLEAFRVSASPASPTTLSALPHRQSRSFASETFGSPHKRRKTTESFDHSGTSILSSPVIERSVFLAQYSPTPSNHNSPFPISPGSVRHTLTSTGTVPQAATIGGQQQLEVDQVDVDANYAIPSGVQSPTYLELPAWPLTDNTRSSSDAVLCGSSINMGKSTYEHETNLGSVYRYSQSH